MQLDDILECKGNKSKDTIVLFSHETADIKLSSCIVGIVYYLYLDTYLKTCISFNISCL